ncbi:MAG: acyltransferase family protein [Actinobacteria bacterium]|nr:acyltransferase family protein [Actinomycetota bacterium]MSX10148.1 acyltransferase family protein [Actinomycetota bacterium]MSX68559.1 acyltransferase family protein [Actinomycetota bacterium]
MVQPERTGVSVSTSSLSNSQEELQDPDSSSIGESISYRAGLDGIRAFAVLAVLCYHGGVSWVPGGFLGVDVFFVLSGFLITTLLLKELRSRETIGLVAFWARRARRLLPALFLVLIFCAIFVLFFTTPGTYPSFGADALSSLLYVANWHFIFQGSNYFALGAAPSLLEHTWSLAIEEQFYVLWPLILLGLFRIGARTKILFGVCLVGALASTAWMAWLFHHGASLSRLYYGTDTHAECILIGAALALAFLALNRQPLSRRWQQVLGGAGWIGLGLIGFLMWHTTFSDSFLYQGEFLLLALSAAALTLCASVCARSVLTRLLSLGILVFLGRISYGLYLWHFPLFQWLSASRVHLSGWPLLGVRIGVTLVVAICSFFFVERPIRHSLILSKKTASKDRAHSLEETPMPH